MSPKPASKTKPDAKALVKPGPAPDPDMAEIEADLAGEPVAAGEKVKPLRMKISKAKERALMKEFGLDETVLSEE
ncbi:MAG: RNA polymerase sigma factor RpoD, partial [Betaproteobacteria bacterium]|nr:RNA polymerase sigma factor RpoD [Betaproteobacteria bacterium]